MSISFDDLRAINALIKSPHTLDVGYQQLLEIDPEELSPGLAMYHAYLKGKCHCLYYDATSEVPSLERADDFFDEIVTIARDNGIRTKNPKYLFKRVHTKFRLSKLLTKETSRQQYYEKACYLTEAGLRYHPTNASFLWLKSQL